MRWRGSLGYVPTCVEPGIFVTHMYLQDAVSAGPLAASTYEAISDILVRITALGVFCRDADLFIL